MKGKESMNRLNDSELENVNGGVLTPEAEDWINRNYNTIVNRAPMSLRGLVGPAMNYVTTTDQVFDVSTLKSTLKNSFGINVDDLY